MAGVEEDSPFPFPYKTGSEERVVGVNVWVVFLRKARRGVSKDGRQKTYLMCSWLLASFRKARLDTSDAQGKGGVPLGEGGEKGGNFTWPLIGKSGFILSSGLEQEDEESRLPAIFLNTGLRCSRFGGAVFTETTNWGEGDKGGRKGIRMGLSSVSKGSD